MKKSNIKDWKLGTKLGIGGFGEVQVAENEKGEKFAMKIFEVGGIPMTNDIEKLKTLSSYPNCHPGVVCYYDDFMLQTNYGEFPALLMELIEGKTLEELTNKIPTPQKARQLLKTAAEALAYVHGKGIVHRDLKPDNIMVKDYNKPDARSILIDFGLSCDSDVKEEYNCNADFMHNPWTSPELNDYYLQNDKKRKDEYDEDLFYKGDIYALGKTFLAFITGKKEGNQLKGIGKNFYPKDRELQNLILSMIDKNKSKRPSAQEVVDILGGNSKDENKKDENKKLYGIVQTHISLLEDDIEKMISTNKGKTKLIRKIRDSGRFNNEAIKKARKDNEYLKKIAVAVFICEDISKFNLREFREIFSILTHSTTTAGWRKNICSALSKFLSDQ